MRSAERRSLTGPAGCLVARGVENAGQQPSGGLVPQQPPAELAQDTVVEARIGEVEGEQGVPVDPGTDCLGGLAVAQSFPELQERDESQAPGCVGGLATLWIEIGEISVGEDGAEP